MTVAGLGQCSWDTLCFLDAYPQVDHKAEVSDLIEQGGGPVATALVALRRMGMACRFSGLVGSDVAGSRIRLALEGEGVDVSGLVIREGESSQAAFIAVERGTARRTIFWQRPTGEPLRASEVPADYLDGTSMLMLDGLMPEAATVLVRRASKMGVPVLLDAGRRREGMDELARLCDHVVGSEVFAREMGIDTARPEASRALAAELFPQGLTITLGERGCVHYGGEGARNGVLSVPACKVDAVDTTGAGDVFHAGYAYGVLCGFDIERTLRFASAAAALSTLSLGGRGSLPGVDEVFRLIGPVD